MRKNILILSFLVLMIGRSFATGGWFLSSGPSCSTSYPGSSVTVSAVSFDPAGLVYLGIVGSSISFQLIMPGNLTPLTSSPYLS